MVIHCHPLSTRSTISQDSLGHMVGIFDGHRGTFCADYLAQEVPKMMVQGVGSNSIPDVLTGWW